MKQKKLVLILVAILIVSLAGCAFSTAIIPLKLSTGDNLNIKMLSDDTYYEMNFDEDDNLLHLYEKNEPNNRFVCSFMEKDNMDDYLNVILDALKNDLYEMEIVDDGVINGVRYTMVYFNTNNKPTYEIIGWIEGTNTGLLFDGFESEQKTEKAFSCITFEVKKTEQSNENYYYKDIDDIENLY